MSEKTKVETSEEAKVEMSADEKEAIRQQAIELGFIKVSRSEGQVAFEEAASRLSALEAELFDLLQQADFPGSVEVRMGIDREGGTFLNTIRTRKEYTKKSKEADAPAPAPAPAAKAKKGIKVKKSKS